MLAADATDLRSAYLAVLVCLLVLCALTCVGQVRRRYEAGSFAGQSLERIFVGTFLLCVAADWLQGPYVYALYDAYGFGSFALASLFVTGFASAMLLGPLVGQFADRYGRKRSILLLYCGAYTAACATKHFNVYGVLFLGRVLGGVATSVLYSSFESWLVCEHARRELPTEALDAIFSSMYFANGLCAIVMGLVAQLVADVMPMRAVGGGPVHVGGYCGPFDLAILFLVAGGAVMAHAWRENADETAVAPTARDCGVRVRHALTMLRDDAVLQLLMVISSAVEAAMYAFIFEWTPALSHAGRSPPHGLVFACFMLCYMMGSNSFSWLRSRKLEAGDLLPAVTGVAASALAVAWLLHLFRIVHYDGGTLGCFLAFLLFEATIGLYMPVLAAIKARHVPEDVRATMYTLFRVPLNLVVVAILLATLSLNYTLLICTLLLLVALGCSMPLRTMLQMRAKSERDGGPDPTPSTAAHRAVSRESTSLLK